MNLSRLGSAKSFTKPLFLLSGAEAGIALGRVAKVIETNGILPIPASLVHKGVCFSLSVVVAPYVDRE